MVNKLFASKQLNTSVAIERTDVSGQASALFFVVADLCNALALSTDGTTESYRVTETRRVERPVERPGCTVVVSNTKVEPMYQYSLEWSGARP